METFCKLDKESRCAVIGHGSWATALVKVLAMNEPVVNWFVSNPEVMESLRNEGRNCRYLSDVEFDMSRICLSDDINDTVSRAEIVILVTPASYLKTCLANLTLPLNDKLVISAIKGFIPDEKMFVSDYLKQRYALSEAQVCFLGGPTHAEEVGYGRLTYLNLACSDTTHAGVVVDKLNTSFLKVNYVQGVRFLERAAVMKNIYAVMVGIALGLGYGDNFISVLVSNCIKEMYFLLDPQSATNVSKFKPSNFFGDLLVSCYSSHSRNRQLGVLIGRGNTVKTALNEMTMVAEGYFASEFITTVDEKLRRQMPIVETAYQILHNDLPARKAMKALEEVLE